MAGFDGSSGQDGLTSQTLYDADLTDGIGLDSTAGVTVTNPLGGTFTVSLTAAITKMAEPIAQGGANTTFNADATGSAVVNLNAENEVSFSISDAQGRSIISGIQHPHDPLPGNTQGDLLTWSCQVHHTIEQLGNGETVLTSINVDALGHTTKARSNALGHTLETIDQLGFVSTVKYDASGNTIETRDPNQTGFDMAYDGVNRSISRTDMVGSQTQSVLDKAGHEITQIDAKGNSTTHRYDARGNRIQTTNRIGGVVQFTYDPDGNQLSVTDAELQTTSYEYDDRGLKTKTIYPDHQPGSAVGTAGYGITECTYDPINRRDVCTDQLGDTKTFNHDLAGRLLSRDYRTAANSPSGTIADTDSFSYDRLSRMLTATSGRYSNVCSLAYNDSGQTISESLTVGGQTYTTESGYDVTNRRTQITYPDGTVLNRSYTDRNQLETLTYDGNIVDTRNYDNGGRLTSSALGNSVTDTRTYNTDNTLAAISSSNPDIGTYSYTWDANKNKTGETITGPLSAYSFTTGPSGYDSEDRITAYDRGTGSASPLTQQWSLSLEGDWSTFTENGVAQTRTHGQTHEVTSVASSVVAHDVKGNITSKPSSLNPADISVLSWDFDNRLSSMDTNSDGNVAATHTYDAMGRRVSKNNTAYVFKGEQVIAEYALGTAATSPTEQYVFGAYVDEPVLKDDTYGVKYYHRNQQYSIVGLTDSVGNAVEYYTYDAYGAMNIMDSNLFSLNASAVNNTYSYTGQRYEPETGDFYFRARYYDSRLGQFLGRDPLGYIDGQSMYSAHFALAGVDPTGLSWFKHWTGEHPETDCCKNVQPSWEIQNYSSVLECQAHQLLMLSLTPPGNLISPALGVRAVILKAFKAGNWSIIIAAITIDPLTKAAIKHGCGIKACLKPNVVPVKCTLYSYSTIFGECYRNHCKCPSGTTPWRSPDDDEPWRHPVWDVDLNPDPIVWDIDEIRKQQARNRAKGGS